MQLISTHTNEQTYNSQYCNQIVNYCKTGGSTFTLAAAISVPNRIIKIWINEYEEFRDALDICVSIELENYLKKAALAVEDGQNASLNYCKFMIDKLTDYKTSLVATVSTKVNTDSKVITDNSFDLAKHLENLS